MSAGLRPCFLWETIMKIWYEPHPVTLERKAELRAQGYRIIDAAFKPADLGGGKLPESEQRAILIAELQAKGIEFDESMPTDELRALSITDPDTNNDGKLSIGEIRAALTERGIDFDPKAKKADLLALLEG